MMRVFFATDVHGSRACWRKFLRCGEFYDADVLILGGDMTGKGVLPIVRTAGSRFYAYLHDQKHEFGEEELADFEIRVREQGLYPVTADEDEVVKLQLGETRLATLFREEVLKTIES